MLENTNSGTIYHLQGDAFDVDALRGLFVETMSSRFNSPLNPPKGGRTAMRC